MSALTLTLIVLLIWVYFTLMARHAETPDESGVPSAHTASVVSVEAHSTPVSRPGAARQAQRAEAALVKGHMHPTGSHVARARHALSRIAVRMLPMRARIALRKRQQRRGGFTVAP